MEERIQRELNNKRVREEIAPYLAGAADRFFGSIIVLVQEPETFAFEPLGEIVSTVPVAYQPAVKDMGVLTIDGGQFVILDGQHRAAALRAVINGHNDKGEVVTGEFVGEVPDDDLSVIFVNLDLQTTRRIFSKINRNAKVTSTADNIIMSEDDGYAIVTRRMLDPGHALFLVDDDGELLINWRSNTLGKNDNRFTTINAVNETVKDILRSENILDFDEKHRINRPPDEELDAATEAVDSWWSLILTESETLKSLVADWQYIGEKRDDPDNPQSLLTRPAMHIVIVRAIGKAKDRGLSVGAAAKRLDGVDWRQSSDLWRDVLVTGGGRIVARVENYNRSSDLLAYLLAPQLYDADDRKALEKELADFMGLVPASEAADEDTSEVYSLPSAS
jgi:DNA sulfur modification protein DndB